jgi:hypothetical protein
MINGDPEWEARNLKVLVDANDKRYEEQFAALREKFEAAINAADRAVTKAETAAEKRFEGVNEFRNTLSDQQRTLMPRAETEIRFKALEEKLDRVQDALAARQNQGEGFGSGWKAAATVLALFITALAIYAALKP